MDPFQKSELFIKSTIVTRSFLQGIRDPNSSERAIVGGPPVKDKTEKYANPKANPADLEKIENCIVRNFKKSFKDIIGQTSPKQALTQALVMPMIYPSVFQGIREPGNGVLLHGPPGTGKTLLAKAAAVEMKSTIFEVTPVLTSVREERRGEMLSLCFAMAAFYSPSTLFIDDVDFFFPIGDTSILRSSLKTAMDNLSNKDPAKRIVVICATSLPWLIEGGVLRRFVTQIYVPLPESNDREGLLRSFTEHIEVDPNVDFKGLADLLLDYSRTDLYNLCHIAATRAPKEILTLPTEEGRRLEQKDFVPPVTQEDFLFAKDKIVVKAVDVSQYIPYNKGGC